MNHQQKCIKCGGFTSGGFKPALARKPSGGVVEIQLHREVCNKCGFTDGEDYAEKITLLSLLPL